VHACASFFLVDILLAVVSIKPDGVRNESKWE
jgi:hypothetical protein